MTKLEYMQELVKVTQQRDEAIDALYELYCNSFPSCEELEDAFIKAIEKAEGIFDRVNGQILSKYGEKKSSFYIRTSTYNKDAKDEKAI